MTTMTFTKTAPPQWLLDMWKEIDDKTFGKGFDCFAENAICNLGVADWHGRETIRDNLRAFIDKGFTALHDVVEYWDSPSLKVFRGTVTMKFDDAEAGDGQTDDDAFLLHGPSRSDQGQALVRIGRSDRLLERFPAKHALGLDPGVGPGSRKENASKQKARASVPIQSEREALAGRTKSAGVG